MGIGPGGRTLLELLEESEKLYRETGHYWGLKKLELYEKDPLRWERERAKLKAIMVLARESATRIAASPITRSIGETCWVLYTPEGDSVVLSTGIIVHVHTMSEEIKWMIRKGYEENPGIMDGDHFIGNDPALGNVHTTDVHTLTPVFYKGTLISWIGSVTHQVDIGANTPGHDICTASGGEWISSVRLEGLILTHPAINECAVVAARSEKWSERPIAVVTLKPGAAASEEEIKSFLIEKYVEKGVIPKWWLPEKIFIVDSIPRTSVGKIDKKKIRDYYKDLVLP